VRVRSYLKESCIIFPIQGSSKQEVIKVLARKAASCLDDLSEDDIFNAILEREELGTTAIGGGVAIPHARVEGLKRISLVVAISPNGVPFDSLDGKPVYVIFMLLAPEEATPNYLRVLASISRLLKNKDLISDLKEVQEASQIPDIIEHAENRAYGVLI